MQIKWTNLIAAVVLVLSLGLAVRHAGPVATVLGAIREIGPGHDADDRIVGLVVLGILLVTLVMLARILTQKDRDRS